MICPSCKAERPEKDFLGKSTCFKCIYKEKTKNEVKKKCKQCKAALPSSRWSYCSDECLEIASVKQKANYWVKKVKTPMYRLP